MGKTIVYWKWSKKEPNVFVEYGIDREHHKNNRLFGVSTEIETTTPDGEKREIRLPKKIAIKTCEIYLRIWMGKFVICFGSGSFSMKIKDKWRLKIIFGRSGTLKGELSDIFLSISENQQNNDNKKEM